MTTLICAGGSGTRVLEAVLHLCAAGLGPDSLRVFVIDSDGTNGSVDKTKKLVDRYQVCHEAFGDGPFFRTGLDLMRSSQGLRVWSPVDSNQQFRNVLNYDSLVGDQRNVVRLLFTEDELEMPMNVGFRGHPALGAAALALLPLYQQDDPLWSQFSKEIAQEVTQGETKVLIAGSVFGGTGASAIHPLVRYLRKLPKVNQKNLKVAAVALVPYFRFSAAEAAADRNGHAQAGAAAESEWFSLASRAAAEYYDHLRVHGDWQFDAMYWIGDDSPAKVEYSIGGPLQDNPAHFVDLLGAFACLDFSALPPSGGACYYAGPLTSESANENVLTWEDMPATDGVRVERRTKLHQFHLVGAALLGFYAPLLQDSRLARGPHCVPWYMDRFAGGSSGGLASKKNVERIDALISYYEENYFPWWNQIHSPERDRVRLFNRSAWLDDYGKPVAIRLNRLGNLLFPDNGTRHGLDSVDALFEATIRSASAFPSKSNLSSSYVAVLAGAAAELVAKRSVA